MTVAFPVWWLWVRVQLCERWYSTNDWAVIAFYPSNHLFHSKELFHENGNLLALHSWFPVLPKHLYFRDLRNQCPLCRRHGGHGVGRCSRVVLWGLCCLLGAFRKHPSPSEAPFLHTPPPSVEIIRAHRIFLGWKWVWICYELQQPPEVWVGPQVTSRGTEESASEGCS